jgi:hypothetical protein
MRWKDAIAVALLSMRKMLEDEEKAKLDNLTLPKDTSTDLPLLYEGKTMTEFMYF